MGPVYYCPGHPSNTISLGAPKFYVCSQKDTSEPLEHCDFVYPQGTYWRSPYHTQNNVDYLQIEIVKSKPQENRNIVVPTVRDLPRKILSDYSSTICSCLYCQAKMNGKKRTHGGSTKKAP